MRLMPLCLLLSVAAMVGFSGPAYSQNVPAPGQQTSAPALGPREVAAEEDYQRNLYQPPFDLDFVTCQTSDVLRALGDLSRINGVNSFLIKHQNKSLTMADALAFLAHRAGEGDANLHDNAVERAYKDNQSLSAMLASLRRCSPEEFGDIDFNTGEYRPVPKGWGPPIICDEGQAKWNYEWAHRKTEAASDKSPAKQRWAEYEKVAKLAYDTLMANGGEASCPPTQAVPSTTAKIEASPPTAISCPSGNGITAEAVAALELQSAQADRDLKRASQNHDAAKDRARASGDKLAAARAALQAANQVASDANAHASSVLAVVQDADARLKDLQEQRAEKGRSLTREEDKQFAAEIASLGVDDLKALAKAADDKASDARLDAYSALVQADLAKADDDRARADLQAAQKAETDAERARDAAGARLANARACPPQAAAPISSNSTPAATLPCPNNGGLAGAVNNVACRESR